MSKVIRTEDQYEDTLERVYELLQSKPAPDSPEGDELDLLATMVEAYESAHHPIGD